jgi:hypothetical protein
MKKLVILGVLLILGLAACQPAVPSADIATKAKMIAEEIPSSLACSPYKDKLLERVQDEAFLLEIFHQAQAAHCVNGDI